MNCSYGTSHECIMSLLKHQVTSHMSYEKHKGSRQNKKTVKLGNFSQPPMTPPPPSKLGKNI